MGQGHFLFLFPSPCCTGALGFVFFAEEMMASSAFDKLFTKSVPHLHEKIFLSIDYTSYKACMKVSNAWKELLSLEPFQSKAKALFHEEITLDEKKLWLTSQRGDVKGVKRLLSSGMLDVNCVSVATCQQRVHHNPWIYPSICDYL